MLLNLLFAFVTSMPVWQGAGAIQAAHPTPVGTRPAARLAEIIDFIKQLLAEK